MNVSWYSADPDVAPRLYWDQGTLQAIVAGSWQPAGARPVRETLWPVDLGRPGPDPADVVIIPGRFHAELVEQINADLAVLDRVLVIVTSDEESVFPWWDLRHPAMRLWVQTPKIEHMAARPGEVWPERWLPEGVPVDLYSHMAGHHTEAGDRALDWWFGGQVTHRRRKEMVRAMRRVPGGAIAGTSSFGAGLAYPAYLRMMASTRVVPCPGGPVTPDTFRLYEALEAGCVPIADTFAGNGTGGGFYDRVFGDVPFPVVGRWKEAPEILDEVLEGWQHRANRCGAWWQLHKRDIAHGLHAGHLVHDRPADRVTVLISTSPVPANPDLGMLDATVASVREQLGPVEILVMCDGVRPEQGHMAADYDEFVRRLVWACGHDPAWSNVCPVVAPGHRHQGLMTRETLPLVHTPLILFVEHDTPLLGEIDWPGLVRVASGPLDVVRLYHEGAVPPGHEQLHQAVQGIDGVPIMVTRQWSQRPHLAKTSTYRTICDRYFGTGSRTMIEDVMHGVVAARPDVWRIGIYAPPGDMRRSGHTDGRRGDPKFDMVYAYDTATPAGAPRPTDERTD